MRITAWIASKADALGRIPAASFWPLLLLIVVLAAIVGYLSPANLKIIPYKLLILCIAVYASHRVDRRFFRDKDDDGELRDIARALVFGFILLALALGL